MPRTSLVLLCCAVAATACAHAPSQRTAAVPSASPAPAGPELVAIRQYIKESWHTLRRSNHDLLRAAVDPKHPPARGRWPVYISAHDDVRAVTAALTHELAPAELAQLEIRRLGVAEPTEHGILYLPHPYVVPGGRFNEMYGWDSYFIVRGLLQDGEVPAALDMANNLLYEVEHYGSILNANRTYYLSRSQPPLLTRTVLEVYARTHDTAWLARAWPTLLRYHNIWLMAPHITDTGLSRYYDSGTGPAPEAQASEIDARGRGPYERVRRYFATHQVPDYDVRLFYDAATDTLTDLYYRADRAMRESGFDPSGRFGPFNAGILEFNPVCLNSLLVVAERDLGQIAAQLGDAGEAEAWSMRAQHRSTRINQLSWDNAAGLYLDYDFVRGKVRDYPFATAFWPLWAKVASPKQAQQLVDALPRFMAPGGLLTSPTRTGAQWDAPYGWAPLQWLAIEGLRNYGYHAEADAIAVRFLRMVLRDFGRTQALFEKYDVVEQHSETAKGVKFGYVSNEVGFGWTNAAFVALYEGLGPRAQAEVQAPAPPEPMGAPGPAAP